MLRKIHGMSIQNIWQIKSSQLAWLLNELGKEFKEREPDKKKNKTLGVPA